ncbi:hypothetical protein [Cupriavidus alkaliphilus]|uniref:hypothetical protein n=1 Tax=Cupriavidus alkaliphilus TaxID=942866 RepID=UPI001621A6DF|nr:hypothetical protein [Cupriavidus alkaliphilus]MBB2918108.1 hypothetical protein [Cupriavidus alkaliphilus]
MAKRNRNTRVPLITSIGARITKEQGIRLAATSRDAHTFRKAPRAHTDDIAVDQLASAMKRKLAKCRAAGRGGWDDPMGCSIERLAAMLGEAVCKGDPVDVANFAMMLHARGGDHQLISQTAIRALLWGSREDQSQRIAEFEARLAEANATPQ